MSESLKIPYCGTPPVPDELWLRWNLDPVLLTTLAALIYLHVRRTNAVPGAGRSYLLAGWTAVGLGLISPICALGVSLFSARVAQHMWLIFIAAPLIVLATATASVRPRLSPLTSSAMFGAMLWTWHVPSLYALTFTSDLAYWLMHITLTGTALLLWQGLLLGPMDTLLQRLIAGFLTLTQMGLLGALLTLAPRPLYSPHVLTADAWGLSALEDQQLGGLIMWVPAGAVLVVACLSSVLRVLRSSPGTSTPARLRS